MKRNFASSLLLLLTTAILISLWLLDSRPPSVTILMYHHFVEDTMPTNPLTITKSKFEKDLEYLSDHHYTTLQPEELSKILLGKQKCPKHAVVISIDDGYQSNYSIAYPILKKHGFYAVIALITANIREQKEENAFMLCWPEVEEMAQSGFICFGSHSDNLHNPDSGGNLRTGPGAVNGVQRLPDETETQYRERVGADLERSCEQIEAHTGTPVLWFAYPYGAGDVWCETILHELGVPISVSTNPGCAFVGKGLQGLPRCKVTEETDLAELLS